MERRRSFGASLLSAAMRYQHQTGTNPPGAGSIDAAWNGYETALADDDFHVLHAAYIAGDLDNRPVMRDWLEEHGYADIDGVLRLADAARHNNELPF